MIVAVRCFDNLGYFLFGNGSRLLYAFRLFWRFYLFLDFTLDTLGTLNILRINDFLLNLVAVLNCWGDDVQSRIFALKLIVKNNAKQQRYLPPYRRRR